MRLIDLTGKRFGTWLVDGQAGVDKGGQALWSCICDCGNASMVRGQPLRDGLSAGCQSCANVKSKTLADSEVTYVAVHQRLLAQRGRASAHTCACACGKPAEQWAYQHGDPRERVTLGLDQRRQTALMAFTPNLDAYEPMSRSCHTRLDIQHAKEMAV